MICWPHFVDEDSPNELCAIWIVTWICDVVIKAIIDPQLAINRVLWISWKSLNDRNKFWQRTIVRNCTWSAVNDFKFWVHSHQLESNTSTFSSFLHKLHDFWIRAEMCWKIVNCKHFSINVRIIRRHFNANFQIVISIFFCVIKFHIIILPSFQLNFITYKMISICIVVTAHPCCSIWPNDWLSCFVDVGSSIVLTNIKSKLLGSKTSEGIITTNWDFEVALHNLCGISWVKTICISQF